jgi:hypothetical protein
VCVSQQEQDPEIGTASYEFESIDKKNRLISDNSIKEHVNIHNVAVFLFEISS